MKKIFGLVLTLILGLAHATENYALTINETALEILRNSRGYKLQSISLEALQEDLKSTSNLPDPEVAGEYLFAPSDETNRWGAEVSWGLEWPGVYGAKGKEAEKRFLAAQKDLEWTRTEELSEIKTLLADYILCRHKMVLIQELDQNNDSIFKLAERAANGGEITVLDLNKIRIEYANIRTAKAVLENEQSLVVEQLVTKYGGDHVIKILSDLSTEFPETIVPDENQLADIYRTSPTLEVSEARIGLAETGKKLAAMQAFPSISIGYKHAFEDNNHFNGATLGISLPIFSTRNRMKSSKAALKEAQLRKETEICNLESEVSQIIKRLILLKDRIDEIAPLIQANDHNALLLKAYEGGLITLLDYISERNYFTTAAMELLSLRHSALLAQIQLQKYLPSIQ